MNEAREVYSTSGKLVMKAREGEPSFVPRRREIQLKRVMKNLSSVRKINKRAQREQEISLFQFVKHNILLLIPFRHMI